MKDEKKSSYIILHDLTWFWNKQSVAVDIYNG